MKTFEEKYTAWIDGKLAGRELAEFERQLAALPEAEADRTAARQLGDLLREHLPAPPLANADFFNYELMQQIDAPEPRATSRSSSFWSLPRMVLAGACSLALATALFFTMVPKTQQQADAGQEYVARILNARSDDPAISATAYHDHDENVTVLWLEGLDYIPESRQLK